MTYNDAINVTNDHFKLPTREQFSSLMNNTKGFTYLTSKELKEIGFILKDYWYWTNENVVNSQDLIWCVYMETGVDSATEKTATAYVVLVRSD